jgi:hypothetical protein
MRTSHIPEEDISRYLELLAHPVADPNPMVRVSFTQHDAETLYERAASGRCTDSDHSVIGYQQVLERGFAGLLADVEAATGQKVQADCYKRPKPCDDPALAPYFAWRGQIGCTRHEDFSEATFGPELGIRVREFLEQLIPLYEYFNHFTV